MGDPEPIFQHSAVEFGAAPDVFPPDCFNAGVLLVKPSFETFTMLVEKIASITSYDGGDTGFLNSVFRARWWNSGLTGPFLRLEYTWNC